MDNAQLAALKKQLADKLEADAKRAALQGASRAIRAPFFKRLGAKLFGWIRK